MILSPQSSDRILLLAPHPDDETLAVGGLLQQAVQAGARVRVVYVTDGENNPWAQRANERRWTIGAADRLRWCVRRRAEALAALAVLGIEPEHAVFLGFPDQRLTDRLLAGDLALGNRLVQELASFGPTHFLVPTTQDAHPDHNALAVEARLALDQTAPSTRPRVYSYLVHRSRVGLIAAPARVPLTAEGVALKGRAIACHATQLKLNRRGLLRFLTSEEALWPDDEALSPASNHPLRSPASPAADLRLDVTPATEIGLGRATLFLVAGRGTAERMALAIPIPDRPGAFTAHGLAGGNAISLDGRATRTPEGRLRFELPLAAGAAAGHATAFAKVERTAERRLGFFDRSGWRVVPAPVAILPGVQGLARSGARSDLTPTDG